MRRLALFPLACRFRAWVAGAARAMKGEGRKGVTEVSCSGFGQAIIESM
ncbi:MAG: hypothetical protein HY744_27140 [Deltaproteobacteria bacterium]|nr:hypothetical protein [Deltaproteobacteria bacterium]